MKVEIDLNQILMDEYGPTEDLSGSIHRQVVESLVHKLNSGIEAKIDKEISEQISSIVSCAIKDKVPDLTNELIDQKFTPIDKYGRMGESTTFRNEIIKSLQDQMQYKPKTWDSDKNYFTKSVDDICKESLASWKKDFDKRIDDQLRADAFKHAELKLKKSLGIK